MTPEEILQALYDETLVGNAPRVLDLTNEGLALDMEPQTLLFDALIPSLEEVGARFERGDFFVPEMLIAGRAMAGAMEDIARARFDRSAERRIVRTAQEVGAPISIVETVVALGVIFASLSVVAYTVTTGLNYIAYSRERIQATGGGA